MNTNTALVLLALITLIFIGYMATLQTKQTPPKDKCSHEQELSPQFIRVDKYSEGLSEAEYEVELVSQDICIVRNVNTDEQWEVKPTEIDQFFMYDNQ